MYSTDSSMHFTQGRSKMLKSDVFKRSASKNHIPTPDDEKQNEQKPTKLDFLRLEKQESITDEESMQERRKKRKSRRSVTSEEKSDPEDDSPRDDYKIEVVRRLMKGFSLNETVAYYRNLNSVEYAINPNNFSLDRFVCILYTSVDNFAQIRSRILSVEFFAI